MSKTAVVDNPVYHSIVSEESDDLHDAAALRADHRINLIDFANHLGPAFGGDGPELLLHHPDRKKPKACLPDLPPMRISVEPVISHRDLAFSFIQGEAFQGQQRPDHVFSHPLGLGLCLGPDAAVDIETRVPPGKEAVRSPGSLEERQ